ncbi:MAG: response regulator [Gammaproteobacteria bacterium]
MNRLNIKTTLLIVGILPTLLTSIAQIGYLSFSQNCQSISLLEYGQFRDQQPQTLDPLDGQRQYPLLTIASSVIGLSGIFLASFMAIYFSRRLNEPLTKETRSSPPSTSIQEGPEANDSLSDQTAPSHSLQFSVLIADDNNINRLLLSNQLEGRCQKITIAKDGVEALHHLTTEHFDLVLLDLQMPGHSGIELIKLIRQKHCINRNTPVIAITAHAQLSQRKKIIAEGFDECLIKPVLAEQLDEIIDLWRPPPNSSQQALNQSYSCQILNKTCQNHELALTIANKLFEELPQQLTHIETALKNKHPELAVEITHKLHGSVSFCGLATLQKPAYALEQSLLNNNDSESNIHFYKLKNATQEFIGSKQIILSELKASQPNH